MRVGDLHKVEVVGAAARQLGAARQGRSKHRAAAGAGELRNCRLRNACSSTGVLAIGWMTLRRRAPGSDIPGLGWNKISALSRLGHLESCEAAQAMPMSDPNNQHFETAVLVHLEAAYNLARWLLGDVASAEDAVQSASLKAMRGLGSMTGPNPKAWFMAIVRNCCTDQLRERKTQGSQDEYDDDLHGHLAHASRPRPRRSRRGGAARA
jgi:hypothetical protein